MKKGIVFLVLLIFTSCKYFNVEKTSSNAILEEELQTFNWNEVDEYPIFETCNASENKLEKKSCFENTLTKNIFSNLASKEIIVNQDINQTILVHFQISEKGKLNLIKAEIDTLITQQIPNLESLLHQTLDSLPKIYPAIKRGQHVKTQFTLPIAIQVN